MDNIIDVYADISSNSSVNRIGTGDTKVLTLPLPTASTLRFDPEEIWGRDGFVVDTDQAFDGEEAVVEVLAEGNEARKKVLEAFKSDGAVRSYYFNSNKYFRRGVVVGHEIELTNARDSLHTISLILQPFYYELGETVNRLQSVRNPGDVPAALVINANGTSSGWWLNLNITSERYRLYVPPNGLVINTMDKSVKTQFGQPIARTAFLGPSSERQSVSSTNTRSTSNSQLLPSSQLFEKDDEGHFSYYIFPLVDVDIDGDWTYENEPNSTRMGLWKGKGQANKYTGNMDTGRIYRGAKVGSFKFPELKPGVSRISFEGGSVSIQVYNRYLLPPDIYDGLWERDKKGR